MRKGVYLIPIIVLFLTLGGCGEVKPDPPKNFAIKFQFGIGAKNVLNTFDGKLTKDLILDGTATTDIKLSEEQLSEIYRKMLAIDFFDYPEKFKPRDGFFIHTYISPHNTYIFRVRAGETIKVVKWEDSNMSKKKAAQNLRDFAQYLMQLVHDSPEFKKLPQPRGGYM